MNSEMERMNETSWFLEVNQTECVSVYIGINIVIDERVKLSQVTIIFYCTLYNTTEFSSVQQLCKV